MKKNKSNILILSVGTGLEGNHFAINDRRMCGPKPWGWSHVMIEFPYQYNDFIKLFDENDSMKIQYLSGTIFINGKPIYGDATEQMLISHNDKMDRRRKNFNSKPNVRHRPELEKAIWDNKWTLKKSDFLEKDFGMIFDENIM